MDPRDQQVVDQLERAVDIFERLAADVHLIRQDLRTFADRMEALDTSVDSLVLMTKRPEAL